MLYRIIIRFAIIVKVEPDRPERHNLQIKCLIETTDLHI